MSIQSIQILGNLMFYNTGAWQALCNHVKDRDVLNVEKLASRTLRVQYGTNAASWHCLLDLDSREVTDES